MAGDRDLDFTWLFDEKVAANLREGERERERERERWGRDREMEIMTVPKVDIIIYNQQPCSNYDDNGAQTIDRSRNVVMQQVTAHDMVDAIKIGNDSAEPLGAADL